MENLVFDTLEGVRDSETYKSGMFTKLIRNYAGKFVIEIEDYGTCCAGQQLIEFGKLANLSPDYSL